MPLSNVPFVFVNGTDTDGPQVNADFQSIVDQCNNGSITTVGTIVSGTWRGTIVEPAFGGTGVANVAKTAWVPTDQSGAGLVFTAVNAIYTRIGNLVFVSLALTYPPTADASAAQISLPVPVPNQSYAFASAPVGNDAPKTLMLTTIGTSKAQFFQNDTGAATTNTGLGGATLRATIAYPFS